MERQTAINGAQLLLRGALPAEVAEAEQCPHLRRINFSKQDTGPLPSAPRPAPPQPPQTPSQPPISLEQTVLAKKF